MCSLSQRPARLRSRQQDVDGPLCSSIWRSAVTEGRARLCVCGRQALRALRRKQRRCDSCLYSFFNYGHAKLQKPPALVCQCRDTFEGDFRGRKLPQTRMRHDKLGGERLEECFIERTNVARFFWRNREHARISVLLRKCRCALCVAHFIFIDYHFRERGGRRS